MFLQLVGTENEQSVLESLLALEENDNFYEKEYDVEDQSTLVIRTETTTEEMVIVDDEDDFGMLSEKFEDNFDEISIDTTTQIPNDYSTDFTVYPDLTTLRSRSSRKRNRNRNRTTSVPLVSDTELLIIGKELFDKETNNLIKYVSINYQNQTRTNETKDCASQKYNLDHKKLLVK